MIIHKYLILALSKEIAQNLGHNFIGIEHFLTALSFINPEYFEHNINQLKKDIGFGTRTHLKLTSEYCTEEFTSFTTMIPEFIKLSEN